MNKDFSTLYIEDGKEFFKRADGKIVFRHCDETIDYRVNELAPAVRELLDRSRAEYNYPSKALVDNLISMQNESIDKAALYVKYRLLGEANYMDVFGDAAAARFSADRHYKETSELSSKIEEMALQLAEMQCLMFNMANTINKSPEYRKKTG